VPLDETPRNLMLPLLESPCPITTAEGWLTDWCRAGALLLPELDIWEAYGKLDLERNICHAGQSVIQGNAPDANNNDGG